MNKTVYNPTLNDLKITHADLGTFDLKAGDDTDLPPEVAFHAARQLGHMGVVVLSGDETDNQTRQAAITQSFKHAKEHLRQVRAAIKFDKDAPFEHSATKNALQLTKEGK